jgi:hypothetical protein
MPRSTCGPIVHRGLSDSGDPMKDLCDRGDWCNYWSSTEISITNQVTVGSLLRAVARDVASFTTLVASLASSVKRTTIGSSAIT